MTTGFTWGRCSTRLSGRDADEIPGAALTLNVEEPGTADHTHVRGNAEAKQFRQAEEIVGGDLTARLRVDDGRDQPGLEGVVGRGQLARGGHIGGRRGAGDEDPKLAHEE